MAALQRLGNPSCAGLGLRQAARASRKLECAEELEREPVTGVTGRERSRWDGERDGHF